MIFFPLRSKYIHVFSTFWSISISISMRKLKDKSVLQMQAKKKENKELGGKNTQSYILKINTVLCKEWGL